jgi:hypothetical protein
MRSTIVFATVASLLCGIQMSWAATIDPVAFDSAALAAAIRKAAPGDTVRLGAGTYELTQPVVPHEIRVGQPASFRCNSRATAGQITDRLWDFGNGIPEVRAEVKHTFDRPGPHRVTLVVWDAAGRGSRSEKRVQVLPGPNVPAQP